MLSLYIAYLFCFWIWLFSEYISREKIMTPMQIELFTFFGLSLYVLVSLLFGELFE